MITVRLAINYEEISLWNWPTASNIEIWQNKQRRRLLIRHKD